MKFPIKPWQHQLDTFEICKGKNSWGIFHSCGAGKSATATHIARYKYAINEKILKTLILCPLGVMNQWHKEFVKFGGDRYEKEVHILNGSTKKVKLKRLDEHKGNIYIINHDSLNVSEFYEWIHEQHFDFTIIDELHRFKAGTSARTKRLIEICKGYNYKKVGKKRRLVGRFPPIKYRFGLSGTPILNSPMDIWSQFEILHPGVFNPNFILFRNEYMIDKNEAMKTTVPGRYFPDWQSKPDTYEKLNSIIYQYADRVKKEDCLDLPPLVKQTIEVPMTMEQKRVYESMKRDFIAFIKDNKGDTRACVANMAMTKGLRLQQIINGIFKDDTGKTSKLHQNRSIYLKEVIEPLVMDNKVIIWTVFAPTYEDIAKVCEDLKVDYVMYTGLESKVEKDNNKFYFQNNPECKVMISNPASGGTGLDLPQAGYSVYYSRNFNLEHYLQSKDRNLRGNSKEFQDKITEIHLVTPDTIDVHVMEALENKNNMAEAIMRMNV